jgi:hypothetical protein
MIITYMKENFEQNKMTADPICKPMTETRIERE